MLSGIFILILITIAAYFIGTRKHSLASAVIIVLCGLAYYVLLLTTAHPENIFAQDPYSKIYSNVWEHAIHGNFSINTQYAFREYFINYNGVPTVYFGFMPAILRGIASLFIDTYKINIGNVSILLAASVAMSALIYLLQSLRLLDTKVRKYSLAVIVAILFGSVLSYPMVWGRIHSEVIVWGASWAIVFLCFYSVFIFGKPEDRRLWHGIMIGVSFGLALMSRPTSALTIAIPYGLLLVTAIVQLWQQKNSTLVKLLWPGIVCAAALTGVVMYINYERWGSPLTFVRMERNLEALIENPSRGEALKRAGEFNLNRVPTSIAYYFIPSQDNTSKEPPFIEIDQRLTVMDSAPQYDYIEGSRFPVVLSMTFLLFISVAGYMQLRRFNEKLERYSIMAFIAGGAVTLLALSAVYTVALRYSVDLLPAVLFGATIFLVALKRSIISVPRRRALGLAAIFVLSVFMTILTTLQYKIVSGEIGLPENFRTNLSRRIHFPPEKDAKIFIINGKPQTGPPYQY